MGKDIKIMLAAIGFTFLLVIGGSALLGGTKQTEPDVMSEATGVEITPATSDWGEIALNGGIISKEFDLKNTSADALKVKKIATSCMCTQASIKLGDKETRFFGMEHATDKNPPVNFEIPKGETAKIIVNFDPAAHGPQGTGPFERVVWLTFSDPGGVKELKFSGMVVSN